MTPLVETRAVEIPTGAPCCSGLRSLFHATMAQSARVIRGKTALWKSCESSVEHALNIGEIFSCS